MEFPAWQTKLSSFKRRHLYAYHNSLFCDVELSVMDANGDKVTIPAHKYVLAISSPFFEAIFYGVSSEETGRTVDLPDCTEEGLQEMLRYVYSDKANLTGSNVLEVLYLAEKYMLPFLKGKCEKFLEEELKPEEVFHVLPKIRNEKVEQKCWDMVDSDTERAVSSESFLDISKEMLCKVIGRDTLSIDEGVLFEAVEKWALNKLKEEGLEENMENKRAVLGEDVIKLIRLPLMSQKKFEDKVRPRGILKSSLIKYSKLLLWYPARSFTNTKREKIRTVLPNQRFKSVIAPQLNPRWFVRSNTIDFKVNRPLYLASVRLFGNDERSAFYNVTLTIYISDKEIMQISTVVSSCSTFSNEDKKTGSYYGFDIHLDKPVPLDPDVVYTIEATIKGPPSYYGLDAKATITFEDIVITYLDSKRASNCTASINGQFPTLIFRRY